MNNNYSTSVYRHRHYFFVFNTLFYDYFQLYKTVLFVLYGWFEKSSENLQLSLREITFLFYFYTFFRLNKI